MPTGTVEGTVAKAEKNEYGRYFTVEGDPRSFFNESKKQDKPWPALKPGDKVVAEYWESDKGKRYVKGEDMTVEAAPKAPPEPGEYAYRDISIGRQSSIKSALEFMRLRWDSESKELNTPISEGELFHIADLIEVWITREPAEEEEP